MSTKFNNQQNAQVPPYFVSTQILFIFKECYFFNFKPVWGPFNSSKTCKIYIFCVWLILDRFYIQHPSSKMLPYATRFWGPIK